MPTRQARWTNPSHPQTLQIAVFLLYANVFWFVLNLLQSWGSPARTDYMSFPWGVLYAAVAVGSLLAGRGIASGAKWAYPLGITIAVAPFVLRVLEFRAVEAAYVGVPVINLMFEIALVALLLHPESRNYQRIWFD